MAEKKIQARFIKCLGGRGWYVLKLLKTNKNGIPDVVAFKNNRCLFVEVKTDKGVLSELQKYRIKELRKNNQKVRILKGKNLCVHA